jgi:hypothetical protein
MMEAYKKGGLVASSTMAEREGAVAFAREKRGLISARTKGK